MLKQKIPTIVGLVLLALGTLSGVLFIDQQTGFLPRARPEYLPTKVKLTNISDTSFNVSWLTQSPTIGFVKYGLSTNSLDTTTTDDRDQLTGSSGEFKTHYITVQGLTPNTLYYFKLGSFNRQLYDNDGSAFSVTTAPVLTNIPVADTAYGTVLTAADTPAEGALLYLNFAGSTPLSALVRQNGSWAISLSAARTTNLTQFVSYSPQNTPIDILVIDSNGTSTSIRTTTGNHQPTPQIILGQDALTSSSANPPSTTPTPLPENKFSLIPLVATDQPADDTLTITNPNQEGDTLNSITPEFFGLAPANTPLTVTLHSAPVYTDTVISDSQGDWRWTPPGTLTPGQHSLTLAYHDSEGILHTLTRTFVITAAASSPSYVATPSATLAPTPTTRPSPTIAPSSAQPSVSPTPSATPSPTSRPLSPTPAPTVPEVLVDSGSVLPSYYLLLIGLSLLTSGFFILKR